MKLIKNNDYVICVTSGTDEFIDRLIEDLRRLDYERAKFQFRSYEHYKTLNYWRRESITQIEKETHVFTVLREPVPVVKLTEELPEIFPRVNVANIHCTEHSWPVLLNGQVDDGGHCYQCGMSRIMYEAVAE